MSTGRTLTAALSIRRLAPLALASLALSVAFAVMSPSPGHAQGKDNRSREGNKGRRCVEYNVRMECARWAAPTRGGMDSDRSDDNTADKGVSQRRARRARTRPGRGSQPARRPRVNLAAMGKIIVDCDIDGAAVYVDGKRQRDKTPMVIKGLKPGTYLVEVKKGPKGWLRTVDVEPAGKEQVTATLGRGKNDRTCSSQDPAGCTRKGLVDLFHGKKKKRRQARSIDSFREACDYGHGEGCYWLGRIYREGRVVAGNQARAERLYGQACDRGAARGCTDLAALIESRDASRARALRQKGCRGGDPRGCVASASAVAGISERPEGTDDPGGDSSADAGGTPGQSEDARTASQRCSAGDAKACTRLGVRYENGDGVAKNLARRFATRSRLAVAPVWDKGIGVKASPTEAAGFFRAGCNGGHVAACVFLGHRYETGKGVSQDDGAAVGWYKKACDKGNGEGCFFLGNMYTWGKGVEKNPTQAKAYHERACALGNQDACAKR